MAYGTTYAYDLGGKVIRVGIIGRRVRKLLDPAGTIGVDIFDPLTKFFAGSNPALILPDMINENLGFRTDGIRISVAQLGNAATVHDVVTVISNQYRANGWQVRVG